MPAAAQLTLSGGAANTNPNASLGGARSTAAGGVVPTALTANSLFDDVSGTEEQAGDIEYRCVYIRNNGDVEGSLWRVYLSGNTADPDTQLAIGLGTSVVDGIEQTVANENTAPTGVTFSEPATDATGLSVGTLAAGSHKALWLRRTVNAGAGASTDQVTIASAFDTGP